MKHKKAEEKTKEVQNTMFYVNQQFISQKHKKDKTIF